MYVTLDLIKIALMKSASSGTDGSSCVERTEIILQLQNPVYISKGHYKFVENLTVYKNMG